MLNKLYLHYAQYVVSENYYSLDLNITCILSLSSHDNFVATKEVKQNAEYLRLAATDRFKHLPVLKK